jgi:hypothetical protein
MKMTLIDTFLYIGQGVNWGHNLPSVYSPYLLGGKFFLNVVIFSKIKVCSYNMNNAISLSLRQNHVGGIAAGMFKAKQTK